MCGTESRLRWKEAFLGRVGREARLVRPADEVVVAFVR